MTDWTPTETTAREVFAEGMASHGQTMDQARASFDRWLQRVKAEAWDEGNAVDRRFNAPTPNPYREESK